MKTTVSILSVCVLLATLVMIPMWIEAQPGGQGGQGQQGPGGQGRPAGPPQEALDACEGKSVDDACGFTTPRGDTVSGTCLSIQEQLACAPEGGPHGGPPQGGQQGGAKGGKN